MAEQVACASCVAGWKQQVEGKAHLGSGKLFLQPLPLSVTAHHRRLQERQPCESVAQSPVHTFAIGKSGIYCGLQLLEIKVLFCSDVAT